jgi:hypothetical protein
MHREIDAVLQLEWIRSRRHCLLALVQHELAEDRRRGGAVADVVVGPLRRRLDHAGAARFDTVGRLDLVDDEITALGAAGDASPGMDLHHLPLGAEGGLHRVGDAASAAHHRLGVAEEIVRTVERTGEVVVVRHQALPDRRGAGVQFGGYTIIGCRNCPA